MEHRTAVHLCLCGCGAQVVTPLGPNDWVLRFDGTVSLSPAVSDVSRRACDSRYLIRNGRAEWL
ncbi:DUF6527 family protein [Nocardioides sp.]|uniref:DUF6527 family protein n=1 Tax=Nocardioides sp. TaxID=35761 RepID=UPI0035B25646